MQKRRWLKRICAFILVTAVLMQTAPTVLYADEANVFQETQQADFNESQEEVGESAPENKEITAEIPSDESVVTESSAAFTEETSESIAPSIEESSEHTDESIEPSAEESIENTEEVSAETSTEAAEDAAIEDSEMEIWGTPMAFMAAPFAVGTTLDLVSFQQAVKEAGIQDYQLTEDGSTISSLTLPNNEDAAGQLLILLSHTDPAVYRKAAIIIVSNLNLDQNVKGLTYAGLGRTEAPFSGSLQANGGINPTITTKYTLFEALSQDATNRAANAPIPLYINYVEDATLGYVPVFARQISAGTGGTMQEWNLHVNHSGRIYGLIDEMEGEQGIKINVSIHPSSDAEFTGTQLEVQPSDDAHAGLICSTLKAGAKLVVGDVTVVAPDANSPAANAVIKGFKVSATGAQNAGGLVGLMETGAKLELAAGLHTDSCSWNASAPIGMTVSAGSGAAGGIVGEMQQKAELILPDGQTLSGIWTVESASGAAGGVIGAARGAIIDIFALYADTPAVTVSAPKGDAGVLAGNLNEAEDATGCSLKLQAGWKVPEGGTYVISGKNVGELAGSGANINLTLGSGSKISVGAPVHLKTITAGGSGGSIIGNYALTGDTTGKLGGMINGDTYGIQNISIDDIAGTKIMYCGGIFGTLVLRECASVKVSGLTITNSNAYRKDNYKSITGGLFGRVYDDGTYADKATRALPTVLVQDVDVKLVLLDDNEHCEQLGGLIGVLGDVDTNLANGIYFEVSTDKNPMNQIYVPHPHAGDNGFGGVISAVGWNSVVSLENIAISNLLDEKFWHGPDGAGLIGTVAQGSAVRLAGTIDLSDMYYYHSQGTGSATGQLIGIQECALVYAAADINLIRGEFISSTVVINKKDKRSLSDIGNYGGVIRKSDFITIDNTTHRIHISAPLPNTNPIVLNSADDFIKLAIAMQSHGYFAGVQDVNKDNVEGLFTTDIYLGANIDLTGTGVYSLTRDCQDVISGQTTLTYRGSFGGQGGVKTLKLATGEKWGKYELNGGDAVDCAILDMEGMGQIYSTNVRSKIPNSHNRIGIFNDVGRTAFEDGVTFKDIILEGTMEFGSNMKGAVVNAPDYREDVYVGGLVAYADGRVGPISFNNITNNLTMTFGNGDLGIKHMELSRVGGLVGGLDNISTMELKNYVGKVCMNYTQPNDYVKLGGVVAEIHWVDDTVLVEDTILSNHIQYNMMNSDSAYAMYGGGLISYMYGTNGHSMTLKGVQVKGQVIDANVAGGYMGGMLGISWQRTNVIFTGEGTDLGVGLQLAKSEDGQKNLLQTASTGAKVVQVGVLCHDASGHWRVEKNGIRIQDTDIRNDYGSLGLILNQGYIGNEGVYLELTDAESYKVDGTSVQITKVENKEFDELIYDGNAGDQNHGAVISIATADGALIDLPDSETRNTYINQTKFDDIEEWNTINARSRYYYNLHLYRAEEGNLSGELNTPAKLLLWSVHTYARDNLRNREFFRQKDAATQCTISGNIDLTGYSYYPVKAEGDVIIKPGTTLTLNNQAIEDKEGLDAPDLRRSTWDSSQHYRMHFGLFREITGSLYVGEENSASPVTLKGNIGGEKNASGFLVTSTLGSGVKDAKKQLNLYHVVLEDAYINGYDGTNVCPLLINAAGSYVDVNIKTLYTQSVGDTGQYAATETNDTWYAASSLMGTFGSDDGEEIAINIEDIRLDGRTVKGEEIEAYDTCRSIFSTATLLHSFAYADQSSYGTYNFIKAEDWNGENALHHVTYGKEISESVRNVDLQYQYYGEPYAVDATTGDNNDTENMHKFATGYLPYVAVGENDKKHEIDVNLKIYHLIKGCGTYGHPYSITQAGEIQAVADYLGTGLAKKGWIVCYNADKDFCKGNSEYDKYYGYDGESWKACDKSGEAIEGEETVLTNEEVLSYLSAAYYSQDADIKMFKKFSGLGTEERPFHGVFVNNSKGAEEGKKYTLTITTEGGKQMTGLVSVSDGCVVKDLQIHFAPEKDGKVPPLDIDNTFGGVIATVLTGDSVIDGVNVTYADGIMVNRYHQGSSVVIGGLVGQVQAGGVILRNITCTGLRQGPNADYQNVGGVFGVGPSVEGDRTYGTNYGFLYCNPYVGRVMDGYVISQGCTLDNGDKNYQIARFEPKDTREVTLGSVANNVYPVEITGADGLFAFSLIMSCGPATADANAGYVGGFRGRGEAAYSMVGKAELTADHADYLASREDDLIDGTSSLIRCFADGDKEVWKTLNSRLISVAFKKDCDMTPFGGAFRGIGFRSDYSWKDGCKVTVAGEDAITGLKADGTVAKITYAMDSKEHVGDRNFKLSGLFNRLYTAANSKLHDLRICGSMQMEIYTNQGIPDYSFYDENTESMSGGGLVGSLYSGGGVVLRNIVIGDQTENSFIIGDISADGTQRTAISLYAVGGMAGMILQNPVSIQDCVINNSCIVAPYCAGGLVGIGRAGMSTTGVLINYTQDTVMEQVTIHTEVSGSLTSSMGGLVGRARSNAFVNAEANAATLTLKNFALHRNASSGMDNVSVGGVLGLAESSTNNNVSSIKNVIIQNIYLGDGSEMKYQESSSSNVYYGMTRSAVGGAVGIAQTTSINLTNFDFQSGTIIAGKDAGGLCGFFSGDNASNFIDCRIASGNGNKVFIWGHHTAGGAVGRADAKADFTFNNLQVGTDEGQFLAYVKYTEHGENVDQNRHAGGIIGVDSVSKLFINNTKLENMTIVAPYTAGGAVGYMGHTGTRVEITNIFVKNNRIINTGIGNKDMAISAAVIWSGSNGVAKNIVGTNVLLDGNQVWHLVDDTVTDNTWMTWSDADLTVKAEQITQAADMGLGNIVGRIYTGTNLQLVGITVQDATIQGKEEPLQDVGSGTYNGYLVYADYLGTCRQREEDSLPGVSPFVNFSPYDAEKFLKVYESAEDTTGIQLYGDGVAFTEDAASGKQSIAQRIYKDGLDPELKTGINEDHLTFYNAAENGIGFDFPVFLMDEKKQAKVDSLVKAYMDLLTGGGASDYLAVAQCQVTINTYQKQGDKFVDIQDASLSYDADTKTFRTVAGKNDSGYNQFTLVEVIFKDPTKNSFVKGNPYTLYIPIIVKLPVEITFHGAVVHDTVFLDEVMQQASSQVVVEYGARATARFAFNYAYNWGAVLETVGANSAETNPLENAFKKAVNLYSSTPSGSTIMPAGTRLTLIDPQRGDKSYSTTLTENKSVLDIDALFTEWDSSTLKSLLHLEKVEGTLPEDEQLWVEVVPVSEEEKAGLLSFGDKYYRAAGAEDTEVYRFVCTEEYFLVMEFPENGTNICNIEFSVPDSLGSERSDRPSLPNMVTDISNAAAKKLFIYQAIDHELTKVSESLVRYINEEELSAENVEGGFVALEATKNKVVLKLKDTLHGTQDYVNLLGTGDKRFLQFSVSMDEIISETVKDKKIPTDVLVEASFTKDDGSPLASYSMVISGETHELILPVAESGDGTKPVNLVDYLKERKGTAAVQATISMTFFPESSLESFPVAKVVDNTPQNYNRFAVTSLLTEKETFLSGARANLEASMAGYYRASAAYAKLNFEADKLSQLGINIKSPDEKDLAETKITGAGYIDAAGIQEYLGDHMICTLRLYQKQNDGSYQQVNMKDYLNQISLNGMTTEADGESMMWSIPAGADRTYDGCYNPTTQNFVIPASVMVRHDIPADGVFANYRLELTVSYADADDTILLTLNPDYFVYTFAKISTNLLR